MTGSSSEEGAAGERGVSPAGGEGAAVRLRGVRKRFGFREVLRGVDLDVARGDCLVLFGANGAGKSTLLRIIATQWLPSSGEGEIFGHKLIGEAVRIRRRIGVVFHQSFLRPELTLDENLRFTADLYGLPSRQRGELPLERLGLGTRRRDYVGTFSQGMTKRANIVRSLLHDPDLWLLDEPFSGLDPEGRELFRGMVRDFLAGGRTVILVTHQLEIGRSLATHVVEVDAGGLRHGGANGGGREP